MYASLKSFKQAPTKKCVCVYLFLTGLLTGQDLSWTVEG